MEAIIDGTDPAFLDVPTADFASYVGYSGQAGGQSLGVIGGVGGAAVVPGIVTPVTPIPLPAKIRLPKAPTYIKKVTSRAEQVAKRQGADAFLEWIEEQKEKKTVERDAETYTKELLADNGFIYDFETSLLSGRLELNGMNIPFLMQEGIGITLNEEKTNPLEVAQMESSGISHINIRPSILAQEGYHETIVDLLTSVIENKVGVQLR